MYAAIEQMIERVRAGLKDEYSAYVFENCYRDTIEKTIHIEPDKAVFILTGDIPAMWLRDSTCQMKPYLPLCRDDAEIADIIEGLIKRQFSYIIADPYANAFNETENGHCYLHDETEMKPIIWERKYELDSLCFPLQLSYQFWKSSGRTSHFTKEWKTAVLRIMEVLDTEQFHETKSKYRFIRKNHPVPDTLSRDGMGALVKENIGMVWSGFRPSDDACTYGYLVPSNMLLTVVMGYLSEISSEVYGDEKLASRALNLAEQVRASIEKNAVIDIFGRKLYAYEIDGFGQYELMDDSNLPSLLSAPYMGYCKADDKIYKTTCKMLLSEENRYYYKGTVLEGIGSPHTPAGYVWDISLAMQGLVSSDKEYKKEMISRLSHADGGTGLMHEGISCNDDKEYTRPWFSWANAMYCELVMDYLGYC